MLETGRVILRVLERLAEGEIKMKTIRVAKILAGELRAHGLQLLGAEAEGLQIREAPVRLAEVRCNTQTPAIRADGLLLASCGAQRMAVAEPNLCVAGVPCQHLGVSLDRLLVIADPCQHHRQ